MSFTVRLVPPSLLFQLALAGFTLTGNQVKF